MFLTSLGFVLGVVVASFFEWVLHRYFMHMRIPGFMYPFERHALVHHRKFKADHTYHLVNEADKETIPMAWWNGPVLIACCLVPFVVACLLLQSWWLMLGAGLACVIYYSAYEYLHWCMHLPKKRKLEKSWIFYRLNGHHLLHHRYMHKNYNTVLPLADVVLGTMLLRSKVRFAQARGVGVPDVQPKIKDADLQPAH
jgi:hypothetical protein